MHLHLGTVALIVFLLNLPFGYWRANESKFSSRWFVSVHAPVPFVVAVRMVSGLGWHLATFPVMIGAFFGGQFAGGLVHNFRKDRSPGRLSSCLVWDMVASVKDRQNDANNRP